MCLFCRRGDVFKLAYIIGLCIDGIAERFVVANVGNTVDGIAICVIVITRNVVNASIVIDDDVASRGSGC